VVNMGCQFLYFYHCYRYECLFQCTLITWLPSPAALKEDKQMVLSHRALWPSQTVS
jgi:hypothetical protein